MAALAYLYNDNCYTANLDRWRILKLMYDLLSAGGWTLESAVPDFSLSTWNENSPPSIIFGMDDSLQATYPVYLKLVVGAESSGSFNPNSRLLTIYIGTTPGACNLFSAGNANGLPTLTTPVYSEFGRYTGGGETPQLRNGGAAGPGYFVMWEVTLGEFGSLFGLERTRDSAGNVTAEGIVMTTVCENIAYQTLRIPSLFAKPEFSARTSGLIGHGTDGNDRFSNGDYSLKFGIGINSYLDSTNYPMEHYDNKAWLSHVFVSRDKLGAGYPSELILVPKRNISNAPLATYHTFDVSMWGNTRKFVYLPIATETFYYSKIAVRAD